MSTTASLTVPLTHRSSTQRAPLRVVALITLLAAALDFAFVCAWWMPQGATILGTLRAMAGWVFETQGLSTIVVAMLGIGVHVGLHAIGVVGAWLAVAPDGVARRRPFATGVLYGVIAYVVTYEIVVPVLLEPIDVARSPGWVTACVAFHALVVGPVTIAALARPRSIRRAPAR